MTALLSATWLNSFYNALCLNASVALMLLRYGIRHPVKTPLFLFAASIGNVFLNEKYYSYYMPALLVLSFALFRGQQPNRRVRLFHCTQAVLLPLLGVIPSSTAVLLLFRSFSQTVYYDYVIATFLPVSTAVATFLFRNRRPKLPMGKTFYRTLAVEWFVIYMYAIGLHFIAEPSLAVVAITSLVFLVLCVVTLGFSASVTALQTQNQALVQQAVEGARIQHFVKQQLRKISAYFATDDMPGLREHYETNLAPEEAANNVLYNPTKIEDSQLNASLHNAQMLAIQAGIKLLIYVRQSVISPLPKSLTPTFCEILDELCQNALNHTLQNGYSGYNVLLVSLPLADSNTRSALYIEIENPVAPGFALEAINEKREADPPTSGLALIQHKIANLNVPGWAISLTFGLRTQAADSSQTVLCTQLIADKLV